MIGPDPVKIGQQVGVEGVGGNGGAVTDDDQLAPGTGQGDIHAPGVSQKADLPGVIAAHQRDDHDFIFAPLKAVDAADLQPLLHLRFQPVA